MRIFVHIHAPFYIAKEVFGPVKFAIKRLEVDGAKNAEEAALDAAIEYDLDKCGFERVFNAVCHLSFHKEWYDVYNLPEGMTAFDAIERLKAKEAARQVKEDSECQKTKET